MLYQLAARQHLPEKDPEIESHQCCWEAIKNILEWSYYVCVMIVVVIDSHSRILLGLYVVMLLSMSIQLDYVLLLFFII